MGADQKFESVKDDAPSHHCNLSDSEVVHKIAQILLPGLVTNCSDVVHKIAQILLPGLVTACIDNTSTEQLSGAKDVRSLTKIVVDRSLKVVDLRGCRSAATNTSLKVMSFN